MQLTLDMASIASLSSALFSIVLAIFLIGLWLRQKNHLYTDLPLLFGTMFLAQAVNSIIKVSPTLGIMEASLAVFRIRTFVILGSVLPLAVVVLNVWFPKLRHRYSRILGLLSLYWVIVTLFAPTEGLVMMLCIPILLVFSIAMIVTFSITWRTGRLKEVRSGLMVLAFVLGFVSQLLASLAIIDNVLIAVSTGIMTLALINPWFRRRQLAVTKPIDTSGSISVQTHG
jgi:MFS family permease